MTDPHARPLGRVRVPEPAHLIAGPTGGMYLADMGADVIKVESREAPDASRSVYGVSRAGEGILHLTVNRNKRALCLDLQRPAGRETFYRVVKTADVVLEGYRNGVAEKLGIDYATLAPMNPRLIYCSVSAFGPEGPWRAKPGLDALAQAVGGLMAGAGGAGAGPRPRGRAGGSHYGWSPRRSGHSHGADRPGPHWPGTARRRFAPRRCSPLTPGPAVRLSRDARAAAALRERASESRALSGIPGARWVDLRGGVARRDMGALLCGDGSSRARARRAFRHPGGPCDEPQGARHPPRRDHGPAHGRGVDDPPGAARRLVRARQRLPTARAASRGARHGHDRGAGPSPGRSFHHHGQPGEAREDARHHPHGRARPGRALTRGLAGSRTDRGGDRRARRGADHLNTFS